MSKTDKSLLPVSIKLLLEAKPFGDRFTIHERAIFQIKLLGQITSVDPKSVYRIEDGTGNSIRVKLYTNNNNDESKEFKKLDYVRIYGDLKPNGPTERIVTSNRFELVCPDAITHHNLEVIACFLELTKKKQDIIPKLEAFESKKEDSAKSQILYLLKNDTTECGMSIGDMADKLSETFSLSQIKLALSAMEENGDVYSTIDENHFKSSA